MKYRMRIYYTEADKELMCDRWQKGDTLHATAKLFDRHHPSIQGILARTGGIRPAMRKRSERSLTLADREEISHGLVAGYSYRLIAEVLGRAPSTVSREVNRNGGRGITGPTKQSSRHGIGRYAQRSVNWQRIVHLRALWRRSSSFSGRRGRLPDG